MISRRTMLYATAAAAILGPARAVYAATHIVDSFPGDDVQKIQAAFAAVRPGDHVVFAPRTYNVTSRIVINRTGYTVQGNGAILRAETTLGHNDIVRLDWNHGAHWEDIRFNGNRNNRVRGARPNLWVRGGGNITLERVVSTDSMLDGFYIGSNTNDGGRSSYPGDVTLIDCEAHSNKRSGLSLVNCRGRFRVIGGVFNRSNGLLPQAGINVEPNVTEEPTLRDVVVEGVLFQNNRGFGFQASKSQPSSFSSGEPAMMIRRNRFVNNFSGQVRVGVRMRVQHNVFGPQSVARDYGAVQASGDRPPLASGSEIWENTFRGIISGPAAIWLHRTQESFMVWNNCFEGNRVPDYNRTSGAGLNIVTASSCPMDADRLTGNA